MIWNASKEPMNTSFSILLMSLKTAKMTYSARCKKANVLCSLKEVIARKLLIQLNAKLIAQSRKMAILKIIA